MNNDSKKDDSENNVTSAESQDHGRREFLNKLGKYSVVASATTVTLLSSRRSAASVGSPGGFGTGPGI